MERRDAGRALDRYLSQTDVWALSLGCIIGWGAFVMPGTTFLPVAGPMGTLIAMAVSAPVMLIIGYNYFYLMRQYPGTGGVYRYTGATLGRDHAFLSAWFLCLSYLSLIPQNATVLAVMCRALFGDALRSGAHYSIAGYDVYLAETGIAAAALLLIGALAIYKKRFLQRVQTALAVTLTVGVIVIAAAAAPQIRLSAQVGAFGTGGDSPVMAVATIIILAPWAFVGFEVISLETAHFRFPVKKTGRLIAMAILLGAGIYAAMALTAVSAQPEGYADWTAYVNRLDRFSGIESIPTFFAMRTILGPAGVWVIALTALSAVLTSIVGFLRASARILMNMAEDGILSERFRKPAACFVFLMGVSILVTAFGRTALGWFVDLSSFGAIVGFGYASVAVWVLARRAGDARARLAGGVGAALAAAFAAAQLIPGLSAIETMGAESYLLLSLWCLLGFAFYWRTMARDESGDWSGASATVAALFFLMIVSAVIWYIKISASNSSASRAEVVRSAAVLLALVLSGLMVMLRIYAQLRRRQLRLETERIRAVENSQAKSRFLFSMSHDIRTPMNAIVGYVTLAQRQPASKEVREYLHKIEASSRTMMHLIDDLLEMSRIESAEVKLSEAPEDLIDVFAGVRDLFKTQMDEKKIDFHVDTAGVIHRFAVCDRRYLERIACNLLSNALKFTPEGGSVAASLREEAGETGDKGVYELRIRDNGIGMSRDFSDRMYAAFERERTSTDSGLEGSGLGLAITRGIVDRMGGKINIDSTPGKGTEVTVRVELPFAQAAETTAEEIPNGGNEGAEADSADETGTGAPAAEFAGRRLLLVEDNAVNREIAEMILSQMGFQVECAENGKIGVEKVCAQPAGWYDAVLMDIQMPVMDGYAAARAIRALDDAGRRNVPIAAMTANVLPEDVRAAREAGMQAHISKPIDLNQMVETLRALLA